MSFGPTCIGAKIPKGDLGFRRFSKPRTLILHHMIELTDGKSLLSQRKIDPITLIEGSRAKPMHMNFEPHERVLYFLVCRLVSKTLIGLKLVDGTSTTNCTPTLLVIQPSPPPPKKSQHPIYLVIFVKVEFIAHWHSEDWHSWKPCQSPGDAHLSGWKFRMSFHHRGWRFRGHAKLHNKGHDAV